MGILNNQPPLIIGETESTTQRSNLNDQAVIANGMRVVDELLMSLNALFPNSGLFKGTPELIKEVKKQWFKALVENRQRTGRKLDIERGLVFARGQGGDYMPSVSTFIAWCSINSTQAEAQNDALRRFNSGLKPITLLDKKTRAECGFEAKRLPSAKSNKLYLDVYDRLLKNGVQDEPLALEKPRGDVKLSSGLPPRKQIEINKIGINRLKALFG